MNNFTEETRIKALTIWLASHKENEETKLPSLSKISKEEAKEICRIWMSLEVGWPNDIKKTAEIVGGIARKADDLVNDNDLLDKLMDGRLRTTAYSLFLKEVKSSENVEKLSLKILDFCQRNASSQKKKTSFGNRMIFALAHAGYLENKKMAMALSQLFRATAIQSYGNQRKWITLSENTEKALLEWKEGENRTEEERKVILYLGLRVMSSNIVSSIPAKEKGNIRIAVEELITEDFQTGYPHLHKIVKDTKGKCPEFLSALCKCSLNGNVNEEDKKTITKMINEISPNATLEDFQRDGVKNFIKTVTVRNLKDYLPFIKRVIEVEVESGKSEQINLLAKKGEKFKVMIEQKVFDFESKGKGLEKKPRARI